jgi:hypothetical protein
VEGILDAVRFGPGGLALLGHRASEAQLALLREIARSSELSRVAVMLDADAQDSAKELATRIPDAEIILLPEGKDPADLSRQELHQLVADAYVLDETFCQHLPEILIKNRLANMRDGLAILGDRPGEAAQAPG